MTVSSHPPKLATDLLHWFVPLALREALIGDLREEHLQLALIDPKHANNWYWKQTMKTSVHYFSRYLASEELLRKLTIMVVLLVFPSLLLAVFWLSSVDEASDYIWNNILQGKMHNILLTSEFWRVSTNTFIKGSHLGGIGMYVNIPSGIWALITFVVLYLRNSNRLFSAHQVAAWGATLMFMPYIFGLLYIDLNNLDPKQIGPIVAIMTISIIYIIVPLAWFVVKKTKY